MVSGVSEGMTGSSQCFTATTLQMWKQGLGPAWSPRKCDPLKLQKDQFGASFHRQPAGQRQLWASAGHSREFIASVRKDGKSVAGVLGGFLTRLLRAQEWGGELLSTAPQAAPGAPRKGVAYRREAWQARSPPTPTGPQPRGPGVLVPQGQALPEKPSPEQVSVRLALPTGGQLWAPCLCVVGTGAGVRRCPR